MQDLNFFEGYIEKSELTVNKRLILYSIATIMVIILVFYTFYNQIKIKRLSRDVNKLQEILEDERINKKIEEIREKQIDLAKSNESLDSIRILDESIEEDSIIDSYLLDNISLKLPEEVFITSISMYSDKIQIIGNSKDKWAIAQLGKGLETIEDFNEVFISKISSEEGYFNFILNISIKDVNIDEEESMEGTENEETDKE